MDNAAAYPYLYKLNAALYTKLTRICVWFEGSPPLLTSHTTLIL
ncbi:uncharacterized protein METZ01_LOCUS483016, partial [marine metagenome]